MRISLVVLKHVCCFGLMFGLLVNGTMVRAVSPPGGLTVSPGQLHMNIHAAQPSAEAVVSIKNTYHTAVSIAVQRRAIDEAGTRLVPTSTLTGPFADAVSLSAERITIPAQGSADVTVSVRDSNQLAPGGHYASLLFTQEGPVGNGSSLHSAVAVSLFVIKTDGIRTDMQLRKMALHHVLFAAPHTVTLTFQNKGNTHVVSRASVVVREYNTGPTLAKAVINMQSTPLFPGKTAEFSAPLSWYARVWWPKKLALHTTYRVEGSDIEFIQDKSFWHVPPTFIASVAAVSVVTWIGRRRVTRGLKWCLRRNLFGAARRRSGRDKA